VVKPSTTNREIEVQIQPDTACHEEENDGENEVNDAQKREKTSNDFKWKHLGATTLYFLCNLQRGPIS